LNRLKFVDHRNFAVLPLSDDFDIFWPHGASSSPFVPALLSTVDRARLSYFACSGLRLVRSRDRAPRSTDTSGLGLSIASPLPGQRM
jgi:hypothetical protein